MDCEQVRELIGAFCAGELDRDTAHEMDSHIGCCSGCEQEKKQMVKVMDAFGVVEVVEPRQDFRVRLWEKIDEWEARRGAFRLAALAGFLRMHRRVVATACVVFVASLLTSVFILDRMTGRSDVRMASPSLRAETVSEGYVIREIPQGVDAARDTVHMHFVTGDRPVFGSGSQETYVYKPVVRPVSTNELTF